MKHKLIAKIFGVLAVLSVLMGVYGCRTKCIGACVPGYASTCLIISIAITVVLAIIALVFWKL